jgi:serine/threonine protein kinase
MGTFRYIAPEVIYFQGGDDLFKTNVYLVGVVMYEIFFGCEPWGNKMFYSDLRYVPLADLRSMKATGAGSMPSTHFTNPPTETSTRWHGQ